LSAAVSWALAVVSKKRKTRRFLRNRFRRLLSLQRRQQAAALRLNQNILFKFVAENLNFTPSATVLQQNKGLFHTAPAFGIYILFWLLGFKAR